MTARYCLADCCKTPNVPMPDDDNSTACRACWSRLEQQLAEMPVLVTELNTTISRQTATGLRNGPRGNEKPMAYNVGASEALEVLHGALWGWLREGLEEHPDGPFRGSPDAVGLARGILGLFGWLQRHEDGQSAIEEINAAVGNAWRQIDRAAEWVDLGKCDNVTEHDGVETFCDEDLRAHKGAKTVRCHTCTAEYDVDERRAYLLSLARGLLVTTREACSAVSVWGEGNISADHIKKWKARGRLVPHSSGPDMWLLGDVIDLATKGMAT